MTMDIDEILALFDREQRIEIEYPDMRKEVLGDPPQIVRFSRPAPGMSFVQYSRLDETNVEAAISEQVAYFSGLGLPFNWKVYAHDTPPDLKERLEQRGFEPDEAEAVMVLDLEESPPALLVPPGPHVQRLTAREQLGDVIRVEAQVWGDNFDWIWDRMGGHLEIPGYLSVYVAYAEGEPACVGWTYFPANSQFASLWGGSTVEAYRGRGLYKAVLAARVQEARARGRRFLVIDTSPMSRPIVAANGFRLLTYAYDREWKVAKEAGGS